MELSRVLLVMGLIGMQIAVSKQELLPAPNLTLLTQGVIYRGQTAKMKCTAPNNFQQSTFYLQIWDDATLIETQQAPMSNHFVIFTLSEFTAPGNYVCRYRNRVDSVLEISQTSNILYLDVLDDPAPTTTNPSPAKITEVPYWIIVLVGVISAIIILGISVTLAVCIRRLYERKKKLKQREKESVWTPREMAKDWSYDNIVYNVEQRPPLDPEHSHVIHLPSRQVLGETWTEKNFSTFHSSES